MSASAASSGAASQAAEPLQDEVFETSDGSDTEPEPPAGRLVPRDPADETFEEDGSALVSEQVDPLQAFEVFMGRTFDPSERKFARPLLAPVLLERYKSAVILDLMRAAIGLFNLEP